MSGPTIELCYRPPLEARHPPGKLTAFNEPRAVETPWIWLHVRVARTGIKENWAVGTMVARIRLQLGSLDFTLFQQVLIENIKNGLEDEQIKFPRKEYVPGLEHVGGEWSFDKSGSGSFGELTLKSLSAVWGCCDPVAMAVKQIQPPGLTDIPFVPWGNKALALDWVASEINANNWEGYVNMMAQRQGVDGIEAEIELRAYPGCVES